MDLNDPRYPYLTPDRPRQNLNIPLLRLYPASNSETNPTTTSYIAPLSSGSSLVSPSTHTSSDQHSDLPDSSLSVSTVTAHDSAFIWNNPPSHPESPNIEDEPLCRDTTFSLPFAAASSSQVLGPSMLNHDDELSLVPSLPESPQAIFDSCIMRLRRQFEGHADPGAYALDLLQFVMAREGVLGPQSTVIPEIRVSNNNEHRAASSFLDVSVSSPAHSATRGHRSPTHCCVLCSDRQLFTSRGSLKRHVSNRHRAKSEFRCPFPQCNWRKNRKDKLRDHLRRHGFPLHWSPAEITQLEAPLPVPTACEVCSMSGFQSWDEWFECIERHCQLPQPAVVHELPDGQGGGNGSGGGGFSSGDPSGASASGAYGGLLDPGASSIGMDFMSNGGGYHRYWVGSGYSISAATEDQSRMDGTPEPATSHGVSIPTDKRALAPASHSPGDDHRPRMTRRKLIPRPRSVESQDRRQSKCRQCGHVRPSQGSAECHKCKDISTISISSPLSNLINYGVLKTQSKPQHRAGSKMSIAGHDKFASYFPVLQLKVYIQISVKDIARALLRWSWPYLWRGESGQVCSTALDVHAKASLIK